MVAREPDPMGAGSIGSMPSSLPRVPFATCPTLAPLALLVPLVPFVPLVLLVLAATALPARAQDAKGKWPPVGPTWETEPAKAFARARAEQKAVMAYVATEGCPHCVVMARETWPSDEVKAVNGDVVFLAVHRNDDVDWTTRLNVIAYPQTLFLDGWGEVLPNGREHVFIRDKQQLVAAVKKFAGGRVTATAPRTLPPALRAAVPKALQDAAVSPDCDVRTAVWRELLPKLSPALVSQLYGSESDAVVRLEALRAMPRDREHRDAAVELASAAVADANDYVRQEAIALLAATGGKGAATALAAVIDKVLGGRSGFANPNNMLCAATKAAATVADPGLVDALARVLKQERANNSATHLAVAALAAIGKKHGRDTVKAALELALKVDGNGADRLHAAARAALQD
jgi:hypothetical protein